MRRDSSRVELSGFCPFFSSFDRIKECIIYCHLLSHRSIRRSRLQRTCNYPLWSFYLCSGRDEPFPISLGGAPAAPLVRSTSSRPEAPPSPRPSPRAGLWPHRRLHTYHLEGDLWGGRGAGGDKQSANCSAGHQKRDKTHGATQSFGAQPCTFDHQSRESTQECGARPRW